MLTLNAKIRTEQGRKTEELRRQGFVPAVLYGPEIENRNLAVAAKDFSDLLRRAGKTSLISLKIDGIKDDFMILINDLSVDPINDKIVHVDLYQPDLKK